MKRILLVDDDVAVTNYLMVFFMQTGRFDAHVVNDSREVPDLLENESFDVMLLDMDMPNLSGMDILRHMQAHDIAIPVIVLTGVSDVDLAVKAMKRGAFDYITKPAEDEQLLEVIDQALEHSAVRQTIEQLPPKLKREDLSFEGAFDHLPTQDPKMIRLFHQVEKMASSDLSIFIWGERGTGKEELARAVHNTGPRRNGPFVAVDAAAMDAERFPADLFGEARDWTGATEERPGFLEQAEGGTLFLDEIEHLSLPVQVRLKRVIQTGEYYRERSTRIRRVDVRFIVASIEDLTQPEWKERFSRDLLYHLMINSVRIPPLRERVDDIPLLAEYFLRREAERTGHRVEGFDPAYLALMRKYDFPDNVQELKTIVMGSVANCEGDVITVESLPYFIREKLESLPDQGESGFKPRSLEEIEREHAARTLDYFEGDRSRTAQELGISAQELDTLLEEAR